MIKSKLFNGKLNYGELIIKGKSKKEILLSTYICHPSMANNEVSGPSVLTFIAQSLTSTHKNEYTYRIIFIPETIGSITYLSFNYKNLKKNVLAGFNISCVGDDRAYSFLPSRNGKTMSDLMAKHILKWIDPKFIKYTWLDRGGDERQYCAPGIDLPIASIFRSKYDAYPEYHSSLDKLGTVVTAKGLDGGYWAIKKTLEGIEKNKIYKVTIMCEPHLGKRGLYPTLSIAEKRDRVIINFISLCDGSNTLLDIAESLNLPIWDLYKTVEILKGHKLIKS